MSASEIVYALVSEQRAGDEIELLKKMVQDVESKPGAIKKPSNQSTPRFGR